MDPLTLRRLGTIEALSPTGASRDALARLLPSFEPGELLSANVLRRLGDGSFTVQLSGQMMRMALPAGIRPGERLSLVFASEYPRLTFLLKQTPAPGEPAAQLSPIGRQVAALMAAASAPGGVGALPAAMSQMPALIGSAPAQGAPLAGELGKTIAQSGLFYESHQAQWVHGQRSRTQLNAEPQARLSTAAVQPMDQPEAGGLTTHTRATDTGVVAPAQAERAIHPATLPLVQQQLGALESGRVAVQVQVWPQQWMQWEIHEQARDERAAVQAPPEWRTHLRLDLPSLGAIEASITLRANGLQVLLQASDEPSALLLAEHRASLRQALEAAGLTAPAISVAGPEIEPIHATP